MILAHLSTDIIGWLTLAAGLIGVAWINKRGQTGAALSYLREANTTLVDEVKELKKERQLHLAEIALLKAKTDVALAIYPLRQWQDRHELEAQERHQRILAVLELIAQRLGPDESGNGVTGRDR